VLAIAFSGNKARGREREASRWPWVNRRRDREINGTRRITEKPGIIEEKHGNRLIRREENRQEQMTKENTATDI